jgi:CxxC motif-containing protein
MSDKQNMTCIVCPVGCALTIEKNSEGKWLVTGNQCPRGKIYAISEMTDPRRIVTTTVKIVGGLHAVVPVKTSSPIPKNKIFEVMDILSDVEVKAPVKIGDVVVKDIAGTGVDVVVGSSLEFGINFLLKSKG